MNKKIQPNPLTIKSIIDYSVKNFKDFPSVSFIDGKPITYAELGRKIEEISNVLFSFGLKKGDKVALLGQNMPNWVIAYFAVVSKGLIVVPILPDFTKDEIENILIHSESQVLFISQRLNSRVGELKTPTLKGVIVLDDFSVLTRDEKLSNNKNDNLISVNEDDIAAIIYTSGTTGRSKGVVLTHKNIAFVAMQSYAFQSISSVDVFLSLLPLSHTYENSIGLLYPIMYGASIYYLDKVPTAAVLLPALAKIRPTMMLSVPLIMEKLFKSQVQAKFTENGLKSIIYKTPLFRKLIHRIAGKKLFQTFGGRLKFFGIGGSKLDFVVERFLREARFPYAIGYGLTETAPLLAGAGVRQTKIGSTGFAVEGVNLKINNPDLKGIGEIWAKGPNVMKEYYKSPEETREVLTDDGWFRTGDFGIIDKNKRLTIKGRIKSTIIGSSGENVHPEDIEAVINNHNLVVESLVIEEDGFLVAKVLLDIEELEKVLEHIKTTIEDKREKHLIWTQHFTNEINTKLNRVSKIKRVDIMDVPFEKTASQKIKRYLYTKKENKKKK
jgi:long-chain acyl-CoA synthetase